MSDLKSMARSKAERKIDQPVAATAGERDKYPWGLGLTFDKTTLQKLGRKAGDFKTGDYVMLTCKAKCTSVTTIDDNGKDRSSVELQIEAMNVSNGNDRVAAAHKKVFG